MKNTFPAIRISGALFAPDLPAQLISGDLPGQQPADFHADSPAHLTDLIAVAFQQGAAHYAAFQAAIQPPTPNNHSALHATIHWVSQLLTLLGHHPHPNPSTTHTQPTISHRTNHNPASTPLHIVPHTQSLDRSDRQARYRWAPQTTLQEYLNQTDHLWGLLSNGHTLALLRQHPAVRHPAILTFDLTLIFSEHRFDDFTTLFRLLHHSRFPTTPTHAPGCLLERYHQLAAEQGARACDRLYHNVAVAVQHLANGFLAHPANTALRAALDGSHHSPTLTPPRLYTLLLRLIYRFLFLLVAEERGLMPDHKTYRDHYGLRRLYRIAERPREARLPHGPPPEDLWCGLVTLWKTLSHPHLADRLGVPPLNGSLFDPLPLDACRLYNQDLLAAFCAIAYLDTEARQRGGSRWQRIHYAALDVEELGSIYERLLDAVPVVEVWEADGWQPMEGRTATAREIPRTMEQRPVRFRLVERQTGGERKSSGSYYTPPELVAELLRTALDPVVEERLRRCPDPVSRERALLSLRVLDPACGSGHFLVAAARRLGRQLAQVRTGEEDPSPESIREAVRDVITHCLYGVELNPLAVELCRVVLWIEGHVPRRPLAFLDHRIRCGDALIGVLHPGVVRQGVPEGAFEPVTGEDREMAAALRRRNRQEQSELLGGQKELPWKEEDTLETFRQQRETWLAIGQDTVEQVRRQRELSRQTEEVSAWVQWREVCDLWTGAFFQRLERGTEKHAVTSGVVARHLAGEKDKNLWARVKPLAAEGRFFHWWLEFPEVFGSEVANEASGERRVASEASSERRVASEASSERRVASCNSPLATRDSLLANSATHHSPLAGGFGFDVILSNPPWERIKFQEEEFFAGREPRIAGAANAARRKRLIGELAGSNPALWQEYQSALHRAESTSRFLRGSGQYPLTGRGDINTYAVFAERIRELLSGEGRAGVILPTGIATDEPNRLFFADLMEKEQLVSLFDFENREAIFPAVHRSYKFCLLTLTGENRGVVKAVSGTVHTNRQQATGSDFPSVPCRSQFAFFITRTEQLRDPHRVFNLTAADIVHLNPNTCTLPVFRTRQDADLTRTIYERVPVLVNKCVAKGEVANPWGVRFLAMFHMSKDSHLFRTRDELQAEGYRLRGNVFAKEENGQVSRYLPLYEAKMVWQYDHRYGTYEGVSSRSGTQLPTPNDAQHADPQFVAQPWYWVSLEEVTLRLKGWQYEWMLGFRNITSPTNERSAVFSLLPKVGTVNTLPVLFILNEVPVLFITGLIANFLTLPFDWVVRQKLAGFSMNFFYIEQFPVLPPAVYTSQDFHFIIPRVLELTYTAWDMQPFADDVWREADETLRAEIRAQWETNRREASSEQRVASEASSERRVASCKEASGERRVASSNSPLATRDSLLANSAIRHSPLANSVTHHSPPASIPFPPFIWNSTRRARIRAELDAWYARLYGLTRKQLRYILDPADLTERELENILDPCEDIADPLDPEGYAARVQSSTFPGETFRVLKTREMRQYQTYLTRQLVLQSWETLPPRRGTL